MSNEILTDEQIQNRHDEWAMDPSYSGDPWPDEMKDMLLAANAEIARLRDVISALRAEAHGSSAEIARLRAELAEVRRENQTLRRQHSLDASCVSNPAHARALRAELAEKERVIAGGIRAEANKVDAMLRENDVVDDATREYTVDLMRTIADAIASGSEQGQGEAERESTRVGGVANATEAAASPDSPVCRWTHVPADLKYPWRSGCGYNTTADPVKWKNVCPFPDCRRPIVTDREEGTE